MTICKCEPQMLSRFGVIIIVNTLSSSKVSKHHSPAHREELFLEGACCFISLFIYPSKEHLTIFVVIQTEIKLDGSQSDKEGDVKSIVWSLVMSSILHLAEKFHEKTLGFFESCMTRLGLRFIFAG